MRAVACQIHKVGPALGLRFRVIYGLEFAPERREDGTDWLIEVSYREVHATQKRTQGYPADNITPQCPQMVGARQGERILY